ncbi:immunoglobulin superfamily containing leucine-rich repeat protein-like [Halichoeres trimaculatus]|uniref:immunoglobulin superfamily containing leucine-rich repeat protein-like n=1 Tax=Halichoeres trimaculatus TaxID=147232 RepID=UPI003D9F6887
MEVTVVLVISLWIATVFTPGLSCPEGCRCMDRLSCPFTVCSDQNFAKIPDGIPSNSTGLTVALNNISLVPSGSFSNVIRLHTLLMAHNRIVIFEKGALLPLRRLRHFDISYNEITAFPWEDLQNLTSLWLLKLNNNKLSHLPKDAFTGLKKLRSIQLDNNKFTTIAEGTFKGLPSLTNVHIYKNPFDCNCSLDWFRDWISATNISKFEQDIRCSSPEKLKGKELRQLTESLCPKVEIRTTSDNRHNLQEGSLLVLTCKFTGNPKPLVVRSIQSRSQRQQAAGEEDGLPGIDSADPVLSHNPVQVIISHCRENDSGEFSCSATNEFGGEEDSVSVEVSALETPGPLKTADHDDKTTPIPAPDDQQDHCV